MRLAHKIWNSSVYSLLLSTMAFTFLAACNETSENKNLGMTDTINLALHESAESFHKRYPDHIRITRQPAGLSFMKVEWPAPSRGSARIEVGNGFLYAEDLAILTAVQNEHIKVEGISTVHLIAGISGPQGITHEAARDYIFTLLTRLSKEGWKSSIPFDDPRLHGKEMLSYQLAHGSVVTLDPVYKPTLQQWIQLPDRSYWEFYNDKAFLRISFYRKPNPEDPVGPGVYLVMYDLDSSVNHFKGFVNPHHREQWKALLPAELKDLGVRRSNAEADLRKQGIPIDTEYQDPPIPW